jgi:cadmium resistance protein CadD (predicted permease)
MMELLNTFSTIRRVIPGRRWIFYAALRLGTFLMIYFSLIGLAAIFLKGPTIMAFIGLVPIMVFIAIRLSGGATEKWRPKGDYKSE